MMTEMRRGILEVLVELSNLYPPMRLGQLVAMACAFAGNDTPGEPETTTDEALLRAAEKHVRKRSAQLPMPVHSDTAALPAVRGELIRALEALLEQYPDMPFGRLITRVSGANVYDIEDEELLEAVERSLPHPKQL